MLEIPGLRRKRWEAPGFIGSQPSLLGKCWIDERSCPQKRGMGAGHGDTTDSIEAKLSTTHMFMLTHAPHVSARMHTHILPVSVFVSLAPPVCISPFRQNADEAPIMLSSGLQEAQYW